MADLYPPSSYLPRAYHHHRSTDQLHYPDTPLYPHPHSIAPQHSGSSAASDDDVHDPPPSPGKPDVQPPKTESKPQATFLTKLYALLERPENHHMIRWDPQGEHIIVERPEQLALHVLPSIYRQSRFASFSRQLNIYGFMRKVNLRNVDPAIDDPDASTWSHPTLNRHSPPEVVANFKRRVPPRLPKPRKRDPQDIPPIPAPRSATGLPPVPLTVPSSVFGSSHKPGPVGRARGFSAPGSFTPLPPNNAPNWGTNTYPRAALPPLTVPPDPPSHLSNPHIYNSHHSLHPLTPADDPPASFTNMASYSSNRDLIVSSSQYPYQDQPTWSLTNGTTSNHNTNGSISSLLNPTNGYGRPTPTINTSYVSPFSSIPMQAEHSGSSLSPDSRPNTGYSMSSVSSLPYQDDHLDYSRPNSSHHRPISPIRPHSSKASYSSASLSVRRGRRHSQAMSPYPSPYDHHHPHHHHHEQQRPSTSPQPVDDHSSSGMPRVRSMIQLPSVDQYSFNPQADFAYSAVPSGLGHTSLDSLTDGHGWGSRSIRPSTATSSISAASHTSSAQAPTPPTHESYHGDTDINRFSPDFGFVPLNEHVPHHFNKGAGEL